MQNKINLIFASFSLLIFSSCNNSSQNKEVIINTIDTTTEVKTTISSIIEKKMIIDEIPFPFAILDNCFSKHIPFNEKVMNSIENSSKYNQYNYKALNLGIYGSDLAYAVTYEQFSLIPKYLQCSKKLAEGLNVDFAFNDETMKKYNEFKDNKDSLSLIVFNSYNKVDNVLKKDDRIGIAALVVAGSWLEGFYIATKTFLNTTKNAENEVLYKTIGKQKENISMVIKLLNRFNQDSFTNSAANNFIEIENELSKINESNPLNEKQLELILEKIEKMRNKIIEAK